MASVENTLQQKSSVLERQTRLIVMWVIATQIAVIGMMITLFGIAVALFLSYAA
ncbi:MAG: hypothetical protein OXI62_07295 [Chloroflexota bacterium]|nr:hypothetical protein [Chloroflexota bacterium]